MEGAREASLGREYRVIQSEAKNPLKRSPWVYEILRLRLRMSGLILVAPLRGDVTNEVSDRGVSLSSSQGGAVTEGD